MSDAALFPIIIVLVLVIVAMITFRVQKSKSEKNARLAKQEELRKRVNNYNNTELFITEGQSASGGPVKSKKKH